MGRRRTVALAAQRHQEAVAQSGGQVRGGDDHRVGAHGVEEVHDLQTERYVKNVHVKN